MGDFIAWHGRTLADHNGLTNQWAAQGYRFVSLSIYGDASGPSIPFSSITTGVGNDGQLQVIGLGQNDGLPYLIWQDPNGGWHWVGEFTDPGVAFSSITTGVGNDGQLQVIGLGQNDGLPYLIWQDPNGGWHWVGEFTDPGVAFSSITTGVGNDGQLQVIGLGQNDGLPYLIWQDPNGGWHWVGEFTDPGVAFSSITTGVGNDGQLQVIGLGQNDGLPYLIWQDPNGGWHWVGEFTDPGVAFSSITTGVGNDGQLQVIGLGQNDGLPYLIWQDPNGGWHWVGEFTDPGVAFSSITTGVGNDGQLQVIGLGQNDGLPYLIWQDPNGGWHWVGEFTDPGVAFSSITTGVGNDGQLQVIGLGQNDGLPYLIWQDPNGGWHWVGEFSDPVYAGVMVKQDPVANQRDFPIMTAAQWQQTFDEQAAQGFGPVILAATGSADDPRFAAVFEPQNPIPLTRHGLTSSGSQWSFTDQTTIQGMDYTARSEGGILRWAASYGTANDPRFAAIWVPNTGAVLWSNDGLTDSASAYQARFDAETAAWCRPSFVTLDADNAYLSLFVADEIGDWVARHNMTPADYQTEFNTWTQQGYFPVCVQAAGASAASAHFAALFVKSTETVDKRFTATGPVANADIDAVMEQTMAMYPPVRHAALAIVHGTQLVYARGYTLAEPDWPVAQPTTFFRLASVSKAVTALAVFQLIESGQLALTDRFQDILQLQTPGGGQPVDPYFGSITVQQLLEHTSGLPTDAFSDGVAVVNAFHSAGLPASLPVTEAMTDQYIATLTLVSPPGTTQAYSNCGYYLLGRLAAKLRGTASPIDAYQPYLLAPLAITRIRSAVDLLTAQLPDEARYQAASFVNPNWPSDLAVNQSLMSPDRPLVAAGYGDDELAVGQGGGGLSAAAPDLARLVAVLIDSNDTAALKRQTLTEMLMNAANVAAAHPGGRSGYGLDWVINQGNGSFYGQKGGLIANAASVLQFKGDWGFVVLWGSPTYRANGLVYPDFLGVMNIATTTNWGNTDLFPDFGMPSL